MKDKPNPILISFLLCQVTSLLADVDVAVKKARLAVQSTSDTANTILKEVVTATEVCMTNPNIIVIYGYLTITVLLERYSLPAFPAHAHTGYDFFD